MNTQHTYVIIRHLLGLRPVCHRVMEYDFELSETEILGLLKHISNSFSEKYPEFKEANWYMDKVP